MIDNGIIEGEACARLTSLTFELCVMDECTHLPSSSLRRAGLFIEVSKLPLSINFGLLILWLCVIPHVISHNIDTDVSQLG